MSEPSREPGRARAIRGLQAGAPSARRAWRLEKGPQRQSTSAGRDAEAAAPQQGQARAGVPCGRAGKAQAAEGVGGRAGPGAPGRGSAHHVRRDPGAAQLTRPDSRFSDNNEAEPETPPDGELQTDDMAHLRSPGRSTELIILICFAILISQSKLPH